MTTNGHDITVSVPIGVMELTINASHLGPDDSLFGAHAMIGDRVIADTGLLPTCGDMFVDAIGAIVGCAKQAFNHCEMPYDEAAVMDGLYRALDLR